MACRETRPVPALGTSTLRAAREAKLLLAGDQGTGQDERTALTNTLASPRARVGAP